MRKIISVSVTNEFIDLIKKYSLSPTEIFRKGIGVSLYDLGVSQFKNYNNKKRSDNSIKILEDFLDNKIEKLKKLKEKIGGKNVLSNKKEKNN